MWDTPLGSVPLRNGGKDPVSWWTSSFPRSRLDDDLVANKAIVEELSKLEGYTIDRLDALYPDFAFDVEAEQAKLVAADVVVLGGSCG